jgi:DNA-binding winged helix-turn-helix (wHTH) protein
MNPLLDPANPRRKPMNPYLLVAHRAGPADETLEFGRFRVLLRQRRLLADGEPVDLGARAFDILMSLVEADGALVTKNELLRLVWPDVVVCPDNLRVQIFALRNALGDDRELVQTEHGRGYRFTGVVNRRRPDLDERRRRAGCHWGHRGCKGRWPIHCRSAATDVLKERLALRPAELPGVLPSIRRKRCAR